MMLTKFVRFIKDIKYLFFICLVIFLIIYLWDNPLKDSNEEENFHSVRYEENETTDFIVVSFIENRDYLIDKCYRITHRTAIRDTLLCQECSDKTSGEIYCDISGLIEIKSDGLWIGKFYGKYKDSRTKELSNEGDWKLKDIILSYWEDKE